MWASYFAARPMVSAAPSREARMSWSMWIRQVHRWLGIAFTATVIANFVGIALGGVPPWITYSPLLPLFLLMFSGLYMFALPYFARRRARPPLQ